MRTPILLVAIVICACAPELPAPDAQREPPLAVELMPDAPVDAAPSVFHVAVRGAAAREAPEAIVMVTGELSDYHLRRIEQEDLPGTLLERLVPVSAWASGDDLWVAPERPLAADEIASLASPRLGRIATVRVASSAPLAHRVWPPPAVESADTTSVYCTEADVTFSAGAVSLEPGAIVAWLSPGADDEKTLAQRCLHVVPLAPVAPPARLVLPPVQGDVALDPTPLSIVAPSALRPASCGAEEHPFGPGCITVLDDRARVRSGDAAALWVVRALPAPTLRATAAGGSFLISGLAPSSQVPLSVEYRDVGGNVQRFDATLFTAMPRPHVVITEVMANPLGPEPASEWVELENDGSLAVDVAGFVLSDGAGESVLPEHVLPPGARALVVRQDFAPGVGGDVAPAPGTALLAVEALGKSGLSNAGEALELRDAQGGVLSRFPALKAKAGRSIARRSPATLDDDASGFGEHADPGASPGAPNVLAE
ncbi:MAG: lamin tail domain-containing protein [Myxococcales bacterium]|nr:lamin tail domain-containing protein [Myxococcales bacterium]MCB9577802.1 lamin tail domain-containing protein [Polyangiaceae bacterium]